MLQSEAMCCGTPVAGYARGGLPEIVTPASGRLAESHDVAGLSVALDEAALLDRQAVRTHAEADLGLERMIDEYEQLLGTTLSARAA